MNIEIAGAKISISIFPKSYSHKKALSANGVMHHAVTAKREGGPHLSTFSSPRLLPFTHHSPFP